jgi:hypothetical protein
LNITGITSKTEKNIPGEIGFAQFFSYKKCPEFPYKMVPSCGAI